MDNEKFKRIFYRYSRQNYANAVEQDKNKVEELNIVKESLKGGCFYEYSIVWYRFPECNIARVEMFSDAFPAFTEEKHLFHQLSIMKNPTPDEVHLLLLRLGYEDRSDNKEVPKECQK